MIAEAAAGFYDSPRPGRSFPRIQILTIDDPRQAESPHYPRLDAGGVTFKKAQLEQGRDKQEDLFAQPRASRGRMAKAKTKRAPRPPSRKPRTVQGRGAKAVGRGRSGSELGARSQGRLAAP